MAETVMRGKFITLNAHIRKEEKSQMNKLSSYLNDLEKQKQNKPKTSRRKNILKTKLKINENKQNHQKK